ncbi:MAG TPA: HPr family phosphocarrier protein [Xanthomonadales bacterium]|nr:HPr family phosphocarrier protein [Xanthomonadales bacterium]
MKEIKATIVNRLGLHARAATQLVNCASAFSSGIWISYGDRRVNAKSIMGVLTLAATVDSVVVIQAEGSDADEALAAIDQLIRDRFNEEA